MPEDSYHYVGIPGHHKTLHISPTKTDQLQRGFLSCPSRVVIPMRIRQGFTLCLTPAGRDSQHRASLAKMGQGGWAGPGALGSSVVKFSKDDPQLVSENTVFLGLLLRAL